MSEVLSRAVLYDATGKRITEPILVPGGYLEATHLYPDELLPDMPRLKIIARRAGFDSAGPVWQVLVAPDPVKQPGYWAQKYAALSRWADKDYLNAAFAALPLAFLLMIVFAFVYPTFREAVTHPVASIGYALGHFEFYSFLVIGLAVLWISWRLSTKAGKAIYGGVLLWCYMMIVIVVSTIWGAIPKPDTLTQQWPAGYYAFATAFFEIQTVQLAKYAALLPFVAGVLQYMGMKSFAGYLGKQAGAYATLSTEARAKLQKTSAAVAKRQSTFAPLVSPTPSYRPRSAVFRTRRPRARR